MKNLCMYLPPYAPDYSGVCSALFDLNSLIVIHDAAGCTGNYTGFDEPRWYGSQKGVYCSGLRKIDVVMGNEYKFVDRIAAAAEQLKPELIAVVGSPVPMVIGTDFAGLCMDVEAATGIPSFGFATNGTNLYNVGVADASIAMIKKYTKEPAQRRERTVNILGATPLDINQRSMDSLTAWLEDAGYAIGARFNMGLTLGPESGHIPGGRAGGPISGGAVRHALCGGDAHWRKGRRAAFAENGGRAPADMDAGAGPALDGGHWRFRPGPCNRRRPGS